MERCIRFSYSQLPSRRFVRFMGSLDASSTRRVQGIPWAALQRKKPLRQYINPNSPQDMPLMAAGDTLFSRYETMVVLVVLLLLTLLYLIADANWMKKENLMGLQTLMPQALTGIF